jgi:hypothetical protein
VKKTELEFSWRSYCKPTPKNAKKVANALLTGALAAVPYIATLRLSEDVKYTLGAALGFVALACRMGVKFFSEVEEEIAETVEPTTGEEPNEPTT